MKKLYHTFFLPLLLFGALLLPPKVLAQPVVNYTSGNNILLTLEGVAQPYNFTSSDLLVFYNRQTQKLECRLNLANLLPASDTLPATMAYEVLYGAKYPELFFSIAVPIEKINSRMPYPQTINSQISIMLQGVTNETVAAIQFSPDENAIIFGTTLNLLLENFQASIPAKYLPLLTGRLGLTIRSARWARPPTR